MPSSGPTRFVPALAIAGTVRGPPAQGFPAQTAACRPLSSRGGRLYRKAGARAAGSSYSTVTVMHSDRASPFTLGDVLRVQNVSRPGNRRRACRRARDS